MEETAEIIECRLSEPEKVEEKYVEEKFSNDGTYKSRANCAFLIEKIDHYLQQLPVVGFYSQRYDLNVLKGPLFKHLHEHDSISMTIKRSSSLPCIKTERLRFMDITNFIAPNFSYEKYLKAFECEQGKGFFPYEWVDSLEKLDHTELPPIEAFQSTLTGKGIGEDDYDLCKRVWTVQGMATFKDFLIWYNNLDVEPFLQAIGKQTAIFKSKGIDMLKSAISLPGLAVR